MSIAYNGRMFAGRVIRARPGAAGLLLALLAAGCSGGGPAGPPPPPGVLTAPPLGWDSWDSFGCGISEAIVRASVSAIVDRGLAAAGYRYVIVDDCWSAPTRDGAGALQADPTRFPSGMASLAAFVHGLGLEFGLYSTPGPATCAQRAGLWPGSTGSLGHEGQDAATFAAWGVDYLKYDLCTPAAELKDPKKAFATMGAALRATDRPIVYSINPNSDRSDRLGTRVDWSATADLWRIGDDLVPSWSDPGAGAVGVLEDAEQASTLGSRVGDGHWNDLDMLVAGVDRVPDADGFTTPVPGLSLDEARAHVSLWAMLASPLIAGNDVTDMPGAVRDLLTNPDVVALDQSPAPPARLASRSTGSLIWVRPLGPTTAMVAVVNAGNQPASIDVRPDHLGLPGPWTRGRDLWTGATWTPTPTWAVPVAAHGVALVRLDR